MSARPRIGELMVGAGLLTPEQLAAALEKQREQGPGGRRLGQLLVEMGLVSEAALTKVLSQHLSVPWVSLHYIDFSRQLLNLLPRELAEEHCMIPIYVRHERKVGDTLYVAMEDPTHDEAMRKVTAASGLPVKSMIAAPSDIRAAIRAFYSAERPSQVELQAAPVPAPPVPIGAARPAPPAPTPAVVRPPAPPRSPPPPPPPPPSPAPPRAPAAPTPPASAPDGSPARQEASAEEPRHALPRRPSEQSPPGLKRRGTEPRPPAPAPPASDGPGATSARMLSLTLLDGTTIQIPQQRKRGAVDAPAPPAPPSSEEQLTTRDLIVALRAVANGASAEETLGDARWETLLAALLTLLLKKQVIADWEFVEEWRKM